VVNTLTANVCTMGCAEKLKNNIYNFPIKLCLHVINNIFSHTHYVCDAFLMTSYPCREFSTSGSGAVSQKLITNFYFENVAEHMFFEYLVHLKGKKS
jgi:hypothetical protein